MHVHSSVNGVLVMRCSILLTFVLYTCVFPSWAFAWNKPQYTVVSETNDGKVLKSIAYCPGEGSCTFKYGIFDGSGAPLKELTLSDNFSSQGTGGSGPEKVSVAVCETRLVQLRDELKQHKFTGIKIDVSACKGNRKLSVSLEKR